MCIRDRHGLPCRLTREDRRVRRARKSVWRGARGPFSSPTCPADFCPTRDCSREDVRWGCARVYVFDKLSCTRLQTYTIDASLKSVSVSVRWNLSFTYVCVQIFFTERRRWTTMSVAPTDDIKARKKSSVRGAIVSFHNINYFVQAPATDRRCCNCCRTTEKQILHNVR